MSYIEIGQETQISIYVHKWSIAFYKLILIEIILVQLLGWRNHIQSVIEIVQET
jgi:hypothetical protein